MAEIHFSHLPDLLNLEIIFLYTSSSTSLAACSEIH